MPALAYKRHMDYQGYVIAAYAVVAVGLMAMGIGSYLKRRRARIRLSRQQEPV